MIQKKGRIVRRTKGYYYVQLEDGTEIECKVKGSLFQKSKYDNQIAVGDQVEFIQSEGDPTGLIQRILERKSLLSRTRVGVEAEQIIATNIDYLLIVSSAKNPVFRDHLVQRMIVAALAGNIVPILVITKIDLVTPELIAKITEPYPTIEAIPFSIEFSSDNGRLREILENSVTVLSGQSGVGKSSLINHLFPQFQLKVGAISHRTQKGSHTTTYARMHQVAPNGYVIDTPGIRGFGLWKIERVNLRDYFPQIRDFSGQCRHRDCVHDHEPDCEVKRLVQEGKIHSTLYQGYLSILESIEKEG